MVLLILLRPLSLSSFLLATNLLYVTARINNNNNINDNNDNNDGVNNGVRVLGGEGGGGGVIIDDKAIPRDLTTAGNNRDLSDGISTPIVGLGDLWKMDFPIFEYEEIAINNSIENSDWSSKFRLRYIVNDMIEDTMFSATWWTAPNCKAGGVPLEQYGIGYEFEYESDGQPPGDGSSTREFNVAFRSAPSKILLY
jgi:hypothetical protein